MLPYVVWGDFSDRSAAQKMRRLTKKTPEWKKTTYTSISGKTPLEPRPVTAATGLRLK
jgi:hypothetical protein